MAIIKVGVNVKTHCIHGHNLDDAYIVYHQWRGAVRKMRICRPCQIARMRAQRDKKVKVNV